MGVGQLEILNSHLLKKRKLAMHYKEFFKGSEYSFFDEPIDTRSNFWLNSLVCLNLDARNDLIEKANTAGIMMRPIWTPMHKLPVFEGALRGDLSNTEWFESRVINIPSSPVEVGHA